MNEQFLALPDEKQTTLPRALVIVYGTIIIGLFAIGLQLLVTVQGKDVEVAEARLREADSNLVLTEQASESRESTTADILSVNEAKELKKQAEEKYESNQQYLWWAIFANIAASIFIGLYGLYLSMGKEPKTDDERIRSGLVIGLSIYSLTQGIMNWLIHFVNGA